MNVCLMNITTTGQDPTVNQILKCAAVLYKDAEPVGELKLYFKHKQITAEPKRFLELHELFKEIQTFKGKVAIENGGIDFETEMTYLCSIKNFVPIMKGWFNVCGVKPDRWGGYLFSANTLPFVRQIDSHTENKGRGDYRVFHNKLKMEEPFVETSSFYGGFDKPTMALFADCWARVVRDSQFYENSIQPSWEKMVG